MGTYSTDSLAEFGDELAYATDEETLEEVRAIINEIEPEIDEITVDSEPSESVGSFSTDDYNALLDLHDEPRGGSNGGPLAGLTCAIKDCIAVKNLRMSCGLKNFTYVPNYDAAVVERLLMGGADVVGKANMEPFAFGPTGENSEYGSPTNPAAPNRVPGGSSSGSGAAVAADLVDFALGTDTGGSVRLPAACCGVVGIKPTHSLVPRHGFVDLVPWTDTIGPLARDVNTAATVLESIAGHDLRDPTSSHVNVGSLTSGLDDSDGSDLTIGLVESLVDVADDEVATPIREIGDGLAAEFNVNITSVSVDLSEISKVYPMLVGDFSWLIRQRGVIRGEGTGYEEGWRAAMAEFIENHEFTDYITSRAMPAGFIDAQTEGRSYVALRRRAIEFQRQLAEVFADVDLLLTPTTRIIPPRYGAIGVYKNSLGMTGNTVPFSFAQTPAVTVPVDTVDDVPVSAQVVAPKFEDRRAIRGARMIEMLVN